MGSSESVCHILALGDSLTEGYYARGFQVHPYTIKLQQLLEKNHKKRKFQIHNHGVSGETSRLIRNRLDEILSGEISFSFAILLAGTNDLGDGDIDSIFGNLKSMHQVLIGKNIQTIMLTIPQMKAEKEYQDISNTRKKK